MTKLKCSNCGCEIEWGYKCESSGKIFCVACNEKLMIYCEHDKLNEHMHVLIGDNDRFDKTSNGEKK